LKSRANAQRFASDTATAASNVVLSKLLHFVYTNLDPTGSAFSSERPCFNSIGEDWGASTDFGLWPGQSQPIAAAVSDDGLSGDRAWNI
jgi:hypothetical protein